MSYISILLPAFHFNTTDKNELIKLCSTQFNLVEDKFELYEFNDNTNNKNFVVKFKKSMLSLNSIEELIYQRQCTKCMSEKSFESLKALTQKISELENQIKSKKENGSEEVKKNLFNDNIKLREMLKKEIDHSENFRVNTEKTINIIREQFESIVKELETMRKKSNKNKPITQRENTLSNNNVNTIIPLGKKNRINSNSSDNKNGRNNNGVVKHNFK